MIGNQPVRATFQSLNLSSRGVLVSDPQEILRRGQAMEFLIHLPTGREGAKVYVHCLGSVIRRDASRQAAAISIQRYEFVRSSAQAAAAGR